MGSGNTSQAAGVSPRVLSHERGHAATGASAVFRWAEVLLFIAGIATLAWCALMVADAIVSQRVARRSLEIAPHANLPSYPREPERTTGAPLTRPPMVRGSAIADLSIPRVRLSAVVLHGSDEYTLRHGPGHVENTALPGEAGNIVIAGHRDSFFRPLRHVRVGDDIFVETVQERFHYRVASLRVVNPYDLTVLDATDTELLTLITCYPFWVLGSAPDRFIVRATREVDPGPVLAARTAPLLFEPTRAPLVQQPPVERPVLLKPRSVVDNETLVRGAVGRFRLTYNARLESHGDVVPGGLLRFQPCDVSVVGDEAAAACAVAAPTPDGGEPPVWTFRLQRKSAGWAIRSIEAR